jgi:pectinesterase
MSTRFMHPMLKKVRCASPFVLLMLVGLLSGCHSTTVMEVAADGSGQFTSIQNAIDNIPTTASRVIIRVKAGTYQEHIVIPAGKPPIHMIGEDAEKTILTYNLMHNTPGPNGIPIGTANSASTTVRSNDFEADNLTFVNSTPRDISQAVALAAEGDRQIYRQCRFIGWQDTLFTNGGAPPLTPGDTRPTHDHVHFGPATTVSPTGSWVNRLYFQDCYIEGGVDFIFGDSTALFQHCNIRSKKTGYLTAASTLHEAAFGYVFMDCTLTANDDVKEGSIYLGRPWRDFSNVIYMNCWMGAQINKQGWSTWSAVPGRTRTVHYAEYHSTGPGASPETRVPWSHQLTDDEANAITVQSVLGGEDNWDPTR